MNATGVRSNAEQAAILDALTRGDLKKFRDLLDDVNVKPNHVYDNKKTLLGIACCERDRGAFIDALLAHEDACPGAVAEHDSNPPLYLAIECRNVDALTRIVRTADRDTTVRDATPFGFLVDRAIEDVDHVDDYVECGKILLENGFSADRPDGLGRTPIYRAALGGSAKLVRLILDGADGGVDVDSYVDGAGKSARDLIRSNRLYDKPLPKPPNVRDVQRSKGIHDLFHMLDGKKEADFVRTVSNYGARRRKTVVDADNGNVTLLQKSVDAELVGAVRFLIEAGADVDRSLYNNHVAIVRACERANPEIVRLLLDADATVPDDCLLHLFRRCCDDDDDDDVERSERAVNECVRLVAARRPDVVNGRDCAGNTALHLAAKGRDDVGVLELLRSGASLAIQNDANDIPVTDIAPELLRRFFDECVADNRVRSTEAGYEIVFEYGFLDPYAPRSGRERGDASADVRIAVSADGDEDGPAERDRFRHEVYPMLHMATSSEHRDLLTHPIVASFLHMKWTRIRRIFYVNLALYSLFFFLLIALILAECGFRHAADAVHVVALRYAVAACVCLLAFRELSQLVVDPRAYLAAWENYLEIVLLALSVAILAPRVDGDVRQQLSVVVVMFSSIEFLLLVGKHPALSTYIAILREVAWNFSKLLLWYSILLLAFALSFFLLFVQTDDDAPTVAWFQNPFDAMLKTVIMFNGDMTSDNLRFRQFPATSYPTFLLFVFMVCIVLFNLLIGLAVDDIQRIKKNAEVVSHQLRIDLIVYIENLILGDALHASFASCGRERRTNRRAKRFCTRRLAQSISLFCRHVDARRTSVRPNMNGVVVYGASTCDETDTPSADMATTTRRKPCSCRCGNVTDTMDEDIIRSAKHLLARKNMCDPYATIKNTLAQHGELLNRILTCMSEHTKHSK